MAQSDGKTPLYPPVTCGLWMGMLVLLIFFAILIYFHVLTVGFARLGLGPNGVMLVILGSFLGSGINIPIKKYTTESTEAVKLPSFFGVQYSVPLRRRQKTVLAVNIGGCVVPVLVSLYVLIRLPAIIPYLLPTVAVCSLVIYQISRPVEGVGIATPFFAPAAISALLAILVAPDGAAAPVAYVTGTVGTLLGADVYNLRRIVRMDAAVASIGGAGTWDGIFLAGLLASLLAF